jgi:hypothetical protein
MGRAGAHTLGAACPRVCRPTGHRPAGPPEGQGWQELTEGSHLHRRHPGTGRYLQEALARRLRDGDPWVEDQWRRLARKEGPAKDAEAELIQDEIGQMVKLARGAQALRRLRPDAVLAWTTAPPFPAAITYIPVVGEELAAIAGMVAPEWVAISSRPPTRAGGSKRDGSFGSRARAAGAAMPWRSGSGCRRCRRTRPSSPHPSRPAPG